MMNNQNLTVHEALEIHELMQFKTVCAHKAAAMSPMVQDPALQTLLTQDVQMSKQQLQQLQQLLSTTF